MLADGGTTISDPAVLRDQPNLLGEVTSGRLRNAPSKRSTTDVDESNSYASAPHR